MKYRQLGDTDLRVSALGLGCSRIGRSLFEDNRLAARDLLETAFEGGINFFDLAPTYTYGDSERIVGQTFAGRRDKVILATKGGYLPSSLARYARFLLPLAGTVRRLLSTRRSQIKSHSRKRQDFSPRQLALNLECSLRRLRTDYVDLYQLHSPSDDVIGSEKVLRFLERAVTSGKARYCGASVATDAQALLCLEYSVYSAVQIGFSVAEQEAVAPVMPLARARGVGIIAKTPLARGLLTKNYRVTTGTAPERPDRGQEVRRRRALRPLLSDRHSSIECAALRFVLDHPDVASVLTGTSSTAHLQENIAAVAAENLSKEAMAAARQFRDTLRCSPQ